MMDEYAEMQKPKPPAIEEISADEM